MSRVSPGSRAVLIGRPYVYAPAIAGRTGVRELLLNLAEAIGRVITAQLGLNLRTSLLEGLCLDGLHLIEPNDVVAVLGLHRRMDLAHGHAEKRIGERRDEASPIRPVEIAAPLR